jgi:hypothetical protein
MSKKTLKNVIAPAQLGRVKFTTDTEVGQYLTALYRDVQAVQALHGFGRKQKKGGRS